MKSTEETLAARFSPYRLSDLFAERNGEMSLLLDENERLVGLELLARAAVASTSDRVSGGSGLLVEGRDQHLMEESSAEGVEMLTEVQALSVQWRTVVARLDLLLPKQARTPAFPKQPRFHTWPFAYGTERFALS